MLETACFNAKIVAASGRRFQTCLRMSESIAVSIKVFFAALFHQPLLFPIFHRFHILTK
ncbi:MAG: hypothetical protein O7C60_05040 [Rickettsia endosymbiont of Ixodes persulcatus]|nr:hypothetical protein [Rickettsia endosymbiont of Ixodes persulcatus]